jgi:hypothetical protein
MDPRQIQSFDVRGWFDHGIDLGNADGAFPGIRQSDQSPCGCDGTRK